MTTLARRYFTSTQMLEIVGSTRKTLRVLEARGLLKPARATGKRRYTQECVRRFWLIQTLREVGVPLHRITEILGAADRAPTGGDAAASLVELVARVQRRITGKIRDLELARDALDKATQTLSTRCHACAKPPAACTGCASSGVLDTVSVLLLTNAGKSQETAGDK